MAVAFLLLPTLILAGAWRLGGVSALEDDLLYYLPMRQYIGERIAAGELPLWNPLVGMGTSIAADPQSGLWYPPTWLFAVLPPLVAYPMTIVLHFALAGWGMYRFLRACGRDWQAAFLGAIAFEFCGFLIAHRVHLTMHHATAWIPWMLYAWRRYAESGAFRHLALGAVAFGLQMLVQHTQISIMSAIILAAYVAVVLVPHRLSLLWSFPAGMVVGAGLGAIQTLPTLYQLSSSGRGVPTFSTFVENSWVPSSAIMLLFPMFFGNRTPNLWSQPWWGLSHFCEQFGYASIIIFLLSLASFSLLRKTHAGRSPGTGAKCESRFSRLFARESVLATDEQLIIAGKDSREIGCEKGFSHQPVLPSPGGTRAKTARRELVFWWAASAVALVLMLGQFTPVSKLLFHLPVYQNLRVPARWILVWSLAMPILASAVVSAIRQGEDQRERCVTALRTVCLRVLPLLVVLCILLVAVLRWRIADLESAFGHRWGIPEALAGLRAATHVSNPAIWWPLLVMILSVFGLLRWARQPQSSRNFALLAGVMLVDLASVASFVDVDTRTYSREQLVNPPPLASAIKDLQPEPGHRLLVPRYQADYTRPLEVLWPQTNMRQGIATFNAYGPFWPKANRLLFRFMPWGSSESMLELLRNRGLCEAMRIRFIAARTPEEHAIVSAMLAAPLDRNLQPVGGIEDFTPIQAGKDLLVPVGFPEPGIYELRFQARRGANPAGQWFVRLETADAQPIGFTRRVEPVDLSEGARELSMLFVCPEQQPEAFVRIKSEIGHAVSVSDLRFARVAEAPAGVPESGSPMTYRSGVPQGLESPGFGGGERRVVLRTVTSDGVSLFELPRAVPLVRVAKAARPVEDLPSALAELLAEEPAVHLPDGVVYEWRAEWGEKPALSGQGQVAFERPSPGEVHVRADCPEPALLVFNETFQKGWTAEVNGQPARILRVNATVQGVIVPQGSSLVSFQFRPPQMFAGCLISGGTLLLLALGLLLRGRNVRPSEGCPQRRFSSLCRRNQIH